MRIIWQSRTRKHHFCCLRPNWLETIIFHILPEAVKGVGQAGLPRDFLYDYLQLPVNHCCHINVHLINRRLLNGGLQERHISLSDRGLRINKERTTTLAWHSG